MKKQLLADLSLLSVVATWGSTFVLTKNALAEIPTYNFLAARFGIALLPLLIIYRKKIASADKTALTGGVVLGLLLFIGYGFQTVGLNYTTASKSAFITGFSAVIVPVMSALALKKKPALPVIIGVFCAVIGLGLLTLSDSFTLNIGDFYTLLATFAFAAHVIAIDKFSRVSHFGVLTAGQIAVVAILSMVFSLWLEDPIIPASTTAWTAIAITSVFATAYAFLVQSMMQKHTTPTHAALIFVSEPVFALLIAFSVLGETLSPRQIIGCSMILMGMLIAEIKLPLAAPSANTDSGK
jgi:drug/metabolite transporter (DMT)-like permease